MERINVPALKQDHPVGQVVARYVRLRPRGGVWVGLCPFHDDRRTPNLTVFPGTQSWYCFACGAGGDVISFVEQIARVDFRQAVDILAEGRMPAPAGPLPRLPRPQPRPLLNLQDDYQRVLEVAAVTYWGDLERSPETVGYLRGRGISLETARRHLVGLCKGNRLGRQLQRAGLPLQQARDLGLLTASGREFFRGRLTIAETTPQGKVLHLTGRAFLDPDQAPKYLAMPNLRKPLYGWARARDVKRIPILTESVTDLLTLSEWGFVPLSPLGTGLKAEHAACLRALRYVAVVPHNDDPGWEAVFRWRDSLPNLLIIPLPAPVKDINDLAQQDPAGARRTFMRLLETWGPGRR